MNHIQLPQELLLIVCDFLHEDLTEDFELVLRPCQIFEVVQVNGRSVIFPCVTQ